MNKSKGKGEETNPPSSSQPSTQGGSHVQAKSSTQDETRTLWCLIDGDLSPFMVTVPTSHYVGDLKELVWEKGINAKTDVLAKDLTLWKVLHTETSVKDRCSHTRQLNAYEAAEPEDDLAERIKNRIAISGGQLSNIASKLGTTNVLLDVFPEQPAQSCVHVIVQRQEGELLPFFI